MLSISSLDCNLTAIDSLSADSTDEIFRCWSNFCSITDTLLSGNGDVSIERDFVAHVHSLCGFSLRSLVQDHFFESLEVNFESRGVSRFWRHFEGYLDASMLMNKENELEQVLCKALEEISLEKLHQERALSILVHSFQSHRDSLSDAKNVVDERDYLSSKYQLMVSSVLLASLPRIFPAILHQFFKGKLEELSTYMDGGCQNNEDLNMDLDLKCKSIDEAGEMDIDEHFQSKKLSENNLLVKNIGRVVQDLRSLGFTSMTEDAYASAIFFLLKDKVEELAGDDYRNSILDSIKAWIQAVPFQFLQALLTYLSDSVCPDSPAPALKSPFASHPSSLYPDIDTPSESLVRWKLRLEYYAYETLQDLRIAKLFDIIVDYPDSSPAIEDLKQCLDYTGQHSKLVESFISALKYRLLTAGASTNDILHQYVSTIKALRTIDPTGIFLEAVGEPICEYLKERKDTIKCIVTMLTDGSGANSGSAGDSLLEELNRDEENQESADLDDDFNVDDKQAWLSAQRWEPDPVEADPHSGYSRRKVDILGMIVGIIGSKDQLVNEYRVVLAEKLLTKSDYDIDAEIRTLELLKIHFGESSMQKCEIMLNDLIDSKRNNSNIKATLPKSTEEGGGSGDLELSLGAVNATIISSNFWPPIQDEPINLPGAVDALLSDYAKRFHEIKTPRKLVWKKNLGVVKLDLQFENRTVQFSVSPLLATIIMHFQDQTRWTSKDLAAAVGVPIDILNRRIQFWLSKGIVAETVGGEADNHIFSLVEGADSNGSGLNGTTNDELLMGDEDGSTSVASVEDQLRKEMTIYEKFIMGMLTNFGSMALDRIHNTLKMFCIADPQYDKSLQQLQSFLTGLVSEEKLELRDGMYVLKK